MDLKLKVVGGKQAGLEVPVTTKKFYIGRAEDCNLRPSSDLISRHHCVLLVDQTYAAVRDFGSKNGTYLNGERITGECELKPGDLLKVGSLEFEIHISHPLGGKKRPPVHDLKEAAARAAESSSVMDNVDVTQWLTGDPSDTATNRAHETQRVKLGDSEIQRLGATQELTPDTPPAVPAPAEHQPEPAAAAPPEKQTPGKLRTAAPHTAKDSREAAAKMLEKLRKRR